jgi:hypothetical protein
METKPAQQNASTNKREMGLFLNGLVMRKNEFPPRNGYDARYSLDIGTPGSDTISVSVERSFFDSVGEMDKFDSRVATNRAANGRTYFEMVK